MALGFQLRDLLPQLAHFGEEPHAAKHKQNTTRPARKTAPGAWQTTMRVQSSTMKRVSAAARRRRQTWLWFPLRAMLGQTEAVAAPFGDQNMPLELFARALGKFFSTYYQSGRLRLQTTTRLTRARRKKRSSSRVVRLRPTRIADT